jgi:hypothetical protein
VPSHLKGLFSVRPVVSKSEDIRAESTTLRID